MRQENESCWRPFIDDAVKYLKGLKLADGQPISSSLRKAGVIGLALSACSIQMFYEVIHI